MLHPVGNLPPHMYWRRRLFLLAIPVVLIIVTLGVLLNGGGKHPTTQDTATTTTPHSPPANSAASGSARSGSSSGSAAPGDSSSISVTTTTKRVSSAPAAPKSGTGTSTCAASDLTVTAGAAHKSFPVKSKPVLYMQLTDTTATPCKLDVADKHVEWRVYSGDVRFWGSHDCEVQPGKNVITLVPNRTVRLSITWSGLTSTPACKGVRYVVQAGTYSLYAYLNGVRSPATTFVIK